jgi:hypothetical protein
LKSVGSGHSGSTGKQKSSSTDYLKAILTNVFQYCGYRHFVKYFKREGKSKISLPYLIRKLQSSFTQQEWYYLRKIHKKENNFFLNKNGKLGESGSGWLELSSKTSKSGISNPS